MHPKPGSICLIRKFWDRCPCVPCPFHEYHRRSRGRHHVCNHILYTRSFEHGFTFFEDVFTHFLSLSFNSASIARIGKPIYLSCLCLMLFVFVVRQQFSKTSHANFPWTGLCQRIFKFITNAGVQQYPCSTARLALPW